FGESNGMWTYYRTPNSDALAEEAIDKCRYARFIPAVYHGKPAAAVVSGTMIFVVIDGKPHLRIFLNQEAEHLKKGDDFICPQEVFWWGDNFEGFAYPSDHMLSGTVCVKLDTDATGKLLASKITYESPLGSGFGKAVMDRINKVTFLPGYLRGKPVACSTTSQILFRGRGTNTYWKTD
ncbi:MAG TPA: hypothetical protein VNW28_01735, partial [Chthoniobacterales bacterium]|nr:hypothetical protein [Chthoniobacterales bacterium]